MLSRFLEQAQSDRPVYITDVRKAFQIYGSRPFHIHVTLYDGGIRCFPLMLPETVSPEEAEFVRSYVHAMLYNILSSLGALRIDLYLDPADRECAEMARALDTVFQTDLPKASRTGFGKCLNVNERTVLALTQGRESFSFRVCDIAGEPQARCLRRERRRSSTRRHCPRPRPWKRWSAAQRRWSRPRARCAALTPSVCASRMW